jgi:hypothetical protein
MDYLFATLLVAAWFIAAPTLLLWSVADEEAEMPSSEPAK